MKIIYILIMIIVIYFILRTINVVSINSGENIPRPSNLPLEKFENTNLNITIQDNTHSFIGAGRENIPDVKLMENEFMKNSELYSGRQYNSRNYKINAFDFSSKQTMKLPTPTDLFILLRSEYINSTYANDKYKFNIPNLIVDNRYPNNKLTPRDKIYLKEIKKQIMIWNNLFPKYYDTDKNLIKISDIKLLFVKETEFEFVVQALIKIIYKKKFMCFEAKYYGQINKTDDILNGSGDTYMLKLIELKPISKEDFETKVATNQKEYSPFISMEDQMEYVNKVKRKHIEETNIYS